MKIHKAILALFLAAGFLTSCATLPNETANITVAEFQINVFDVAVMLYCLDNGGEYPTTKQGLSALVEKTNIPPVPINFPQNGYLTVAQIPLDPWGNPYIYSAPGKNGNLFEIRSAGPDGIVNTEDDITNKERF